MRTSTLLRDTLGTELPIIQAPMAGAQAAALAVATCNAGALGSMPCALLSHDAIRDELALVRQRTTRPYNVNFFCHTAPAPDAARDAAWRVALAPFYRELGLDSDALPDGPTRAPFTHDVADVVEPFRPPVVSFHFGLPSPDLLARVRGWGSRILGCATTVDEARWLETRGVDAIVAQGLEAGGHRGNFLTSDLTTQIGTFALLPQVVRAVRVPVVAAGGIADAAGVAAAHRLGASAVQIGTAYLLCPEALTTPVHRAALASPEAAHTALTNVISGRPARGIVNRIMRELGPLSDRVPEFPLATPAVAPLRAAAEAHGSGDFSPLWAGQNVTGCKPIPAAELTEELASHIA
jgi:nitronate monooxygenase